MIGSVTSTKKNKGIYTYTDYCKPPYTLPRSTASIHVTRRCVLLPVRLEWEYRTHSIIRDIRLAYSVDGTNGICLWTFFIQGDDVESLEGLIRGVSPGCKPNKSYINSWGQLRPTYSHSMDPSSSRYRPVESTLSALHFNHRGKCTRGGSMATSWGDTR